MMAYQPEYERYAGYPPDALDPVSYTAYDWSGHDGLPSVDVDRQIRGEAAAGKWDVDFANRLKDVIARTENEMNDLPRNHDGKSCFLAEAQREKARIEGGYGFSSAYDNNQIEIEELLPRHPKNNLTQSSEQSLERPRFTLDRPQSIPDRSGPTIPSTFALNNVTSFPETYIPPSGIDFIAEKLNLQQCLFTSYKNQFTSDQLAHDFRLLWWYRWGE
jgi:hypothetical protein